MDSMPPVETRIDPGTVVANYVVEDFLGQGTEGCVYVARDSLLGRQVALKTLRAGGPGETRGVEEARVLAGLEHPNIVRVYHARRHQGVWFVVYEYLAGGSLQSQVQRLGALPLRRALEVIAQAASGLAHAHAVGILHRDVKPQNLLLSKSGEVKLADFGLALDLRGRTRVSTQPVGTPAFLAPELWSGSAPTPASDVFSLGACLYYVLTGRLPFVARDQEQLCRAQLELEPKLPVGLPSPVRELVLAMMAKDPDSRPPCPSLASSLRALGDNPYRPTTPPPDAPRLTARDPFVGAGAEQATRKAVRAGPDAAYVSELLSALRARPKGVELGARSAAQALLLSEVALDHAGESHALAVRLTLPNAPGLLLDVINRKLERLAPGSLREACSLLLEPTRDLMAQSLLEVCVRRAPSEEQRRELEVLSEVAAAKNVVCLLVGAVDDLPGLHGYRRVKATSAAPQREQEERLATWIELATGGRYAFSRDGLRLAAALCEEEGRFWPRLAQDSVLIAAAAGLPVVTSWAVLGARAQAAPCHSVDDVPAAYRRRPEQWPPPDVAARLAQLRDARPAMPLGESAAQPIPLLKSEPPAARAPKNVVSNT